MTKTKKIKCDCGQFLVEKKVELVDIEADAMICNKCGFTTLTKGQAEKCKNEKHKEDLIFAIRTKEAWKSYKRGEFTTMDSEEFLKMLEKL